MTYPEAIQELPGTSHLKRYFHHSKDSKGIRSYVPGTRDKDYHSQPYNQTAKRCLGITSIDDIMKGERQNPWRIRII